MNRRSLFLILTVMSVFPAARLLAQRPDFRGMTDAQCRLQMWLLGSDDRERGDIESLRNAHHRSIEALESARDRIVRFTAGTPQEVVSGPPAERDRRELMYYRSSADAEAIDQEAARLIGEIDDAYFERLARIAPDRPEAVEAARRAWRRAKMLGRVAWNVAGADVDVMLLAAQLKCDRDRVRDVLQAWEARARHLIDEHEPMIGSYGSLRSAEFNRIRAGEPPGDLEAMARETVAPLRIGRDLLRAAEDAVAALAAALDEDQSLRLRGAWLDAKYPVVRKPGPEEALIAASLGSESITEDARVLLEGTQARIDELRGRFTERLERGQRRYLDLDAHEQYWIAFVQHRRDRDRVPEPEPPSNTAYDLTAEFIAEIERLGREAAQIIEESEDAR